MAAGDDADATTVIGTIETITATDTNGLLLNVSAPHFVDIDSDTGPITLGSLNTTDAITFISTAGARTATFDITSSGTNNLITFAGDLEIEGNELFVLNATNTTTLFSGDITKGTGTITINVGNGASALSTTFDTAVAGNNTIDADISANSSTDTVILEITNTDGTSGNQLLFDGNIGGIAASSELDQINVQSGAKATFNGTVNAARFTINSSETSVINNSVTSDVRFGVDSIIQIGDGGSITGSVDNLTGSDGNGTLELLDQTSGPILAMDGSIGQTNSLKKVSVDSSSNTITLTGAINATTISVYADDDSDQTVFNGHLSGTLQIDTAGTIQLGSDSILSGSITTNSNGKGSVVFAAPTSNLTLVSGDIGTPFGNALKSIIVNTGVNITSSFSGNINAETIEVSGSGNAEFIQDIESDTLDFTGNATALIAANKAISGNVDATSTQGNLVFAETTANTTLVSGSIGSTNSLNSIEVTASSGRTASFGDTVSANTISVNGTGTVAFTDDVTGNINIAENTAISFSSGKRITGSIDNTSGSDNSGSASFAAIGGNITLVSGSMGATNTLRSVTVDTTGGVATFAGAIKTENFTATGSGSTQFGTGGTIGTLSSTGDIATGNGLLGITGDVSLTGGSSVNIETGDLEFNGNSAQTISASINGANSLSVNNTSTAGVTFDGAIGSSTPLDALTLAANSKTIFSNTVQAASLSSNGNLQVGNTLTLSGTATFNGGTLTIGDNFTPGDTIFSVNDLSATNSPVIQIAEDLQTGTYLLFDSVADASDEIANFEPDTSILRSTELQANGNDIQLVVTTRTSESLATEFSVTNNQARILLIANEAIETGNDALLNDLIASVNSGGSTAQKAIKSLGVQSENMDAAVGVASALQNQVFLFTSDRLAAVRNQTTASRLVIADTSTDRPDRKNSAWMKAFGFLADQDRTSGGESYEAGTVGSTFGYDVAITETNRVGASFTYAYTDVEGGGAGSVSSQLKSYQGNFYADYSARDFFIEGSIGFGHNQVDSSRIIDFLGIDTAANSSYHSNQYIASVQVGSPISSSNYQITPMAGLSYTYLQTEDYLETGAGGLNQQVQTDDLQLLTVSVGSTISTQLETDTGFLIPRLSGGIRYELLGENAVATSQFTGGGSTFTVDGQDPEQLSAHLGLGLTYDLGDWILGADYNADFKNNYHAHSAALKAKLHF